MKYLISLFLLAFGLDAHALIRPYVCENGRRIPVTITGNSKEDVHEKIIEVCKSQVGTFKITPLSESDRSALEWISEHDVFKITGICCTGQYVPPKDDK